MRALELSETPFLEELDEAVYTVAEPAAIVALLRRQGIPDREVLQGTGIRPSMLRDPYGRVSTRQRMTVYRNAVRLSTDASFGLQVGDSLRLSSYGIYGLALLSSRTLRSAIEFAFRYLKLAGPLMEKTVRLEGDKAVFEARDTLNLGDILPIAVEIWFSSTIAMMGDTLREDFRPAEMHLAYPPPSYAHRYGELWGCDVVFGAARNAFFFDAAHLDRRLIQSNELSLKMCKPVCEKLLAEFDSHEGPVEKLRRWMLMSPTEVPNLDAAAHKLNVTGRTLRRKLSSEGTSFRQIRSEVREALAAEYLRNTDLTTAEIAERIGFSDSANFRSAFKRWTKLTPSAYRSQSAAGKSCDELAMLWDPAARQSA